MSKMKLKTLKVCTLCDESRAKSIILVSTTGIVNKKETTGKVCPAYQGKMVCGHFM